MQEYIYQYHVPVLRKSVFSLKKSVFLNLKKSHQKPPSNFLIKVVFGYDNYSIWRNNGWSRLIVSHSADKNTEIWKINVRYTKWVSKYSSDSSGQEKYHNIPLTPTGSSKTGRYPKFSRKVKLELWRHTHNVFSRNCLDFLWQHVLWSYKIWIRYHKFE